MLAIIPAAIFWGFGPAILACLLSVVVYGFFFVPPIHTLNIIDFHRIDIWFVFFLTGLVISYLSSNLRNKNQIANQEIMTRKKAEIELIKYQEQLEDMVKQRTSDLEKANLNLIQEIGERKLAEADLAKAKDELEIKVQERTASLKSSNTALQTEKNNAQKLLNIVGVIVIALDTRGNITLANARASEILGYSEEEIIGRNWFKYFLPERIREQSIDTYTQILSGNQNFPEYHENPVLIKSGDEKLIAWHNSILAGPDGEVAGILRSGMDITERRRMERSLKEYAQKITHVQEEERKRIAYELHDDAAQYLAILKLQLNSLLHSGKIQSPDLVERIGHLEKDASRAADNIRSYSHELRPTVLEHIGLQAALEQLAEDVNKLKQIVIEVNTEGIEPDLSEEERLGFFRVAQEALNNCRKHSRASKVIINLRFNESLIEMEVSDDGIGFDTQLAATSSGLKGSLGLMSMQERAELMGANLSIESKPGEGTTVSVNKTFDN